MMSRSISAVWSPQAASRQSAMARRESMMRAEAEWNVTIWGLGERI